MITDSKGIFDEYSKAVRFKSSIGTRGLYEQNRINERFYSGDQWYGAKCGNSRPLVRYNIIKRIGDYKMSQVSLSNLFVSFSADGVANTVCRSKEVAKAKEKIAKNPDFSFYGDTDTDEINIVMSALKDYRNVTAQRVGFEALCIKALRDAYINGSSVFYTYWDSDINTGLFSDRSKTSPVKGDICCEVLNISNVYFADPYLADVQKQPYIIIASRENAESVTLQAKRYGIGDSVLSRIKYDRDGKVTVLTKLFKEYKSNGEYTVKCVKTVENAVIRPVFDTRLRKYPIALLRWQERGNLVYGESEITYLIPNQIAINRMITANVWSTMTTGMPLMVVNGDTVSGEITNEPGQIIKIFGSNEDVNGAVRFVSPPECDAFSTSITSLIENTLTQSGANEVALGDSRPDNAAALLTMQEAATMPLKLIKERYYCFIEEISRIWIDFWITQYGNRKIKIKDENGVWYMPFDTSRYSHLLLGASVEAQSAKKFSPDENISLLTTLYDKGIINKKQLLKRLPQDSIADIDGLLEEDNGEDTEDDGI